MYKLVFHGVLAASVFASLSTLPGCAKADRTPTNVVLIVIDTLRADHCSAYGYERETTPNLDTLATEGILFENAWAQAPWTNPSMVSMLSGRYVLRNYTMVPSDIKILPERFREAGYATGALIANPVLYSGTGFERGFDYFEAASKKESDSELLETTLPAEPFASKATTLLTEKLREPFFAWLHLFDPHKPYNAPEHIIESLGDLEGASAEEY